MYCTNRFEIVVWGRSWAETRLTGAFTQSKPRFQIRVQYLIQIPIFDYRLTCKLNYTTENSILYYLQYAPLGRPRCSSEGKTTITTMTTAGLNQYLKTNKKNKCTLGNPRSTQHPLFFSSLVWPRIRLIKIGYLFVRCFKVMFYSTSCQFSIRAAPVFNGIPSLFPSGLVVAAIEAPRKWTIEHGPGPAEFGVLGTPSIILFHGRKEIGRFNESIIELNRLYQWTKHQTKLKPLPLGTSYYTYKRLSCDMSITWCLNYNSTKKRKMLRPIQNQYRPI